MNSSLLMWINIGKSYDEVGQSYNKSVISHMLEKLASAIKKLPIDIIHHWLIKSWNADRS